MNKLRQQVTLPPILSLAVSVILNALIPFGMIFTGALLTARDELFSAESGLLGGFVVAIVVLVYGYLIRPYLIGLYFLFLVWWNDDYDDAFTASYIDRLPIPLRFKLRIAWIVLERRLLKLSTMISKISEMSDPLS